MTARGHSPRFRVGPKQGGRRDGTTPELYRDIHRQPMLSREEELDLARRSWRGDAAAAARLASSHLRFVITIARKYRNYGLPMNDLIHEGTIGLMQAVKRFDPARDVRFATYAMWWIRAAIQDHVVRSWSLVRVGTTAAQKALFFNLRRMMVDLRDGADALGEDVLAPLAKRFGMPLRDVAALARRVMRGDYSLNRPTGGDDGDEWIDRLPDRTPTPEDAAVEASETRFWNGLLSRALAALPPREQIIIRARFLAEAAPTREILGRQLGISKERVRQLESRALDKLRGLLAPVRKGARPTI
ncbi:MAG: RNA polymerase factor sigma-32 [Alphaproteobacteria bacterium]